MASDITLFLFNNQFTVKSGASNETCIMTNNKIGLSIGSTRYSLNPLSSDTSNHYLLYKNTNLLTVRILT